MMERRARAQRREWSWGERVLFWIYNVLVGPFLTRLPDGTVQGSMTRIATAMFTIAEIARLRPQFQPGAGLWLVPVIGWPDAFMVVATLFALPLDNAMTKLADKNPERLLELFLGRMGIGDVAGQVIGGINLEAPRVPEGTDI